MAEGGPGRGRGGRGAMIAKLLELQKKPGQLPASLAGNVPPPAPPTGDVPPPAPPAGDGPPPAPSSQETTQVLPPRPGGRGAMLLRLQQQVAEQAQPPPVPAASTEQPPVPKGRGRLMQMASGEQARPLPAVQPVSEAIQQQPVLATSQPQSLSPSRLQSQPIAPVEAGVESISRQIRRIQIDSDRPPVSFRGKSGYEITATANYIRLALKSGRGIYEYEVRFNPVVDDRAFCDKLLFVQHRELLGRRRTFDGVTLYLPHKLEEAVMKLTSTHPVTSEPHIITLTFKRERSMGECVHMYNVLFNNIQRELNLVRLGREYYSQELSFSIPQHRLEIWPGYITAVDMYEGGIMLNCNATSKVLRTQTVLNLIDDIIHSAGAENWKNILQKMLIGQSVMTRTPVKIYRVDDIDFNQNPTSTFQKQDGTTMDYVEYHRRKDIQIRDLQQPLLIHRPKPSKRPQGAGLLMLIPELCFLTGLTDEMRSDFKVMKDVAVYTRVNPNQRQLALQKFIDSIKNTPNCVKLLDEWGLEIPNRTIDIPARVLDPEKLNFGRGYVDRGSQNADWGRSATSQHMLETVDIYDWIVISTQKDNRNAGGFAEMMMKVCPQMGVRIQQPHMQSIQNDRTETYLRALKEGLNESVQLVVVIFPSARDDRYAAIKKLCCVDRPIPSQVINSRTISRPDKLRSIVQKIALQINCKLGGALWSVNIPFKNAMICGIDTYHDSKIRAQSVAGFVASLNVSVTRWHSQVFIQSSDREMVDGLRVAMCTALNKYYQVNNHHPDTVVIFRDGVGDGQLTVCKEHEINAIQKAFSTVSHDYEPAMVFVVCQKRINTRIFMTKDREFDNPPPGTVVDHTVTRRYYEDFFLVSQMVRQGTVTPTHYIVLHNTTRLDADKIQKLTYKMCHMYYNWPGTVRVPAPCQYAHKLAHLVGCSIHKEPAGVLCDKLFFL